MDWLSLGTSLVKLGAPVLASVFLGPEAGPLAGALVGKLADAFDVPNTPEAVQHAIAIDPDAATKVQDVEATHRDIIEAMLADVQNARSTEVEYIKAGSFMQAVPGIWTVVVVGAFAAVLGVLLLHPIQLSETTAGLLNLLLGVLVGEVARCGSFWLGSSQSSRLRADQAIDFAHKATAAPKAVARR